MMRHKYLPRILGGVLLAGTAMAGLGCSDSTGPGTTPPAGPQLLLTLDTQRSDSLPQLGVAITVARSDSATLTDVRIYVDSAAGVQPIPPPTTCCSSVGRTIDRVARLPGPGRHTLTAISTDTAGRVLSARATVIAVVPDEAYAVAVLPDSGSGAGVTSVHASGDVTGFVVGTTGRARGARWRAGRLTTIVSNDTFNVRVVRTNTAADVLYAVDAGDPVKNPRGVRVLRADGTTLVLPGDYAQDLTDARVALATAGRPGQIPTTPSVLLNVATGALSTDSAATLGDLNTAGQAVGTVADKDPMYASVRLQARGFTLPSYPGGPVAGVCDFVGGGRYSYAQPVDLDESANVLAFWCGNAVWLPQQGTSLWLDRAVGASKAIHLSRTGGIVASLDPGGTIYLWRAATGRTSRLAVAGNAWTFDDLGGVNASGQIAAHGVERATGRAAALLLTPAP